MAPIVATRPVDGPTVQAASPGMADPSDSLSDVQVMVILVRIAAKLDAAVRQLEATPATPQHWP